MVGDFAAAQQPVIVVLTEGTSLTVQAVVSSDRRFVRLTVVPFFSTIGDVRTFTIHRHDDDDQQFVGLQSRRPILRPAREARKLPKAPPCSCRTSRSCRSRPPSACPTAARCCWAASSGLSEGRNEARRADFEQAAVHQSLVPQRRHRPHDEQPDDDGHAANHHPGRRGRKPAGHCSSTVRRSKRRKVRMSKSRTTRLFDLRLCNSLT